MFILTIIKHEGNGVINLTGSVKEYLNEITPYLKNIQNSLKFSDKWETQITVEINFISFQERH